MAGKVRNRSIPRRKLALAVAAALVPFTGAEAQTTASTLPTGGQVTAGSAAISLPGNNKMQVDQSSDKAILQWQSFSIGSGAWVNFTQPSASSIALNRVTGTNPSEIFGRLTANGQVFLSNPSGVLFAPGASVDVGGLFATTLSIADRDFLAGRYNFYNAGGAGSVVNQGLISASAYAALAGPQVRNDGIIVAQSGTVALAAGDRVSLDMVGDGLISVSVDQAAMSASAINAGTLQADGGRVILTARSANALLDTVVNNSGIIRANSLVERNGEIVLDGGTAGVVANTGTLQAAGADVGTQGGTITVAGDKVSIASGSVVDASGDSGGGTVTIGRGASATIIGTDATIRADATGEGSGGSVETSGAYLELGSAPQVGAGGSWIIDPFDIQIVGGTGTVNNTGGPSFTPNGEPSQIGATLIVNQLNAGASVLIDTGSASPTGTPAGDITVNAAVNKTFVNASTLTLKAAHDIAVNSSVILNSGGLTLSAGHDITVNTTVTGPNMNATAGNAILLNAVTQDATLNSSGGQTISAAALTLHAENNRRAVIQNTIGNQNVTIGAGGIDLNVLGGTGVAQIASNNPNNTTFTAGTQTVQTTGVLSVLGGAIANTNNRNSGVFQNQTGQQTVTAGGIAVQAAATANAQAGASISTNGAQNGGGADQEINVAAGTITVSGGGIGLTNRASIVSSRNQTINGNADIFVSGGTSGTGTNDAGTNNQASIAANSGTQTIFAHDITLKAGTGGTDTSATINGATQKITASGDVRITGGSNDGDSNGARIGASGTTTTGTNLTLQAHNVTLTGGSTSSGAAIGNSQNSVGLPSTITISASGDVTVNSGDGNGARIGAPKDDTGGGKIKITATGNIALNGGAHGANIRTADDVTLNAANISETPNGQILAGSLTLTTSGEADLGGSNTIAKISTLSAGGRLNLNNVGTLTLDATSQDAKVSSSGGQTITADGLMLHAENGHVASITNTTGDQNIAIGAGGIDLDVALTGQGVAQIANNSPRVNNVTVLTPGTQTVQSGGALTVVGGSTTTGSTNSGIFQNQTGKQTVSAGSISLQAANAAVNSGGALISNTAGGGDQEVDVAAGTITLKAGGIGLFNRASITTNGNQTIGGNADITLQGGDSGNGTNAATPTTPANSSNAALISIATTSAGKTQTINAHSIALQAGSGGTDTFAAITNNSSVVAGSSQIITATGDVSITGGANSGVSNGARIGAGVASTTGTNLKLSAQNVFLKGGKTTSAAVIGNTSSANTPNLPNNITITAGGDVKLNSGDGNGARIGAPNGDTGAGNISITAAGRIALNPDSAVNASTIRTAGDVTLNAASMSEAPNGQILAHSLVVNAGGAADLGGANAISVFTGASGGFMTLGNTGALAVTGLTAGGTLALTNTGGALTLNAGGTQDALVNSVGGQTIIADSISLTAQDGRRALLMNSGGGNQIVSANLGSIDLVSVGGAGTAKIVNESQGSTSTGVQLVVAAGDLNVVGGSAVGSGPAFVNSGIFQNATGPQLVAAQNITLHGADRGSNGAALISNANGGGDQTVVASGNVTITGGGSTGSADRAGILTNGTQLVSAFDIAITGGANGAGVATNNSSNSASISSGGAGKLQSVVAHDITLTAGAGGNDTSATITGTGQNITASGDVHIKGSDGNTGSFNGARIGGPGSAATSLTLSADNVFVDGGAASGAAIGGNGVSTASNDIAIVANHDVVLTAGIGRGVRIGTAPDLAPADGTIRVSAGGNITLSAPTISASINTAGDVSLNAGGSISESGNAFIRAGSLTTSTTSGGAILLGGGNSVSVFNASTTGDVVLSNSGALDVTGLAAFNATLTNAGSLALSLGAGPSFLTGNLSITTTGAGADLLVTGGLFAGSGMDLDIAGAVNVVGSTPGVFTNLSTGGAQNIDAGGLAVTAQNGGFASLNGGTQSITITRGSVDVQSFGGFATINASGPQAISVLNGDHFNVNGAGGFATVGTLASSQAILLTGSGRNAITVGSTGALGGSQLFGASQSVKAGDGGDTGSITIVGSGTNGALAGFVTNPVAGGTQTISSTGEIRITGGSAPAQTPPFPAGIFHNGSGAQTINAGSITLNGGTGGNGNAVFISSNGGGVPAKAGNQNVNVAGDLTIKAGSTGSANRAGISSSGNQAIAVGGDLAITGGDGGAGRTSDNTSNGAFIIASNAARTQKISARNITLNAGTGGNDTFASITAATQTISASEDVRINGGSNVFVDGAGARIGGLRAPATTTNLTLSARDVILTGGAAPSSGAALGGNPGGTEGQTIVVNASRDFIMESRAGSGARVGTNGDQPAAPGDITINAGRDIQLNGSAQPTTIRSSGNVTLAAGGAISEGSNGSITASGLTTSSGGSTSLGGPNQVATFAGSSGDDLLLNNSVALTIAGITAANATLTGGDTISEAPTGAIVANSLSTTSAGSTHLGGPNQVSALNATSAGGSVLFTNTGALNVTGLSAFGDATLDNTGNVTISGPWTAGGTTSITVHSDLVLQNALASQSVELTATSGSIREEAGGSISAGSLTTSSFGDTALGGVNTVGTFSASSGIGRISLSNADSFNLGTISTTGAVDLRSTAGSISELAGGAITADSLTTHAAVDTVLLGANAVKSLTGDAGRDFSFNNNAPLLTIGGASASAPIVLTAGRDLSLSSTGSIVVRASDTTLGAGSYLLAGGTLGVHAGSFSLVGGAAPFAPAVAGGSIVDIATTGDLTLTGGSGAFSPALLLGGTGIDLTVGGTLSIDGNTSNGSFARVQTATRDGSIHITFTNASGDYVVDGLDGRIKHGQDGFCTGELKPAKPGDTFFVTYE